MRSRIKYPSKIMVNIQYSLLIDIGLSLMVMVKKTEVQGPGVIGEQPHIYPGESFNYTSGAVLDTPVGTMQGYYEMQQKDGDHFEAAISVFSLAVPNVVN